MVAAALDAAAELHAEKISVRVIDMHTVKPIDEDAIVRAAKQTKGIVVAEEHLPTGGLGATVASVVTRTVPTRMAYVNIGDRYAESGDPDGLLQKYGLTPQAVASAARGLLKS
jgi:transketolase